MLKITIPTIFVFLFTITVESCLCFPGSPRKIFKNPNNKFKGVVLKEIGIGDTIEKYEGEVIREAYIYKVLVTKRWKGSLEDTVFVKTTGYPGMCPKFFYVNTEAIFITSSCSKQIEGYKNCFSTSSCHYPMESFEELEKKFDKYFYKLERKLNRT